MPNQFYSSSSLTRGKRELWEIEWFEVDLNLLHIIQSEVPFAVAYCFQVLHFVVSHVDIFISILQDRQAVHTPGSLQELGLVTGIMCNMGLTEATLTADEELGQEQIQLRGPLARIQRLMIGLLPRYCSSDNWEKVSCTNLLFMGEGGGFSG